MGKKNRHNQRRIREQGADEGCLGAETRDHHLSCTDQGGPAAECAPVDQQPAFERDKLVPPASHERETPLQDMNEPKAHRQDDGDSSSDQVFEDPAETLSNSDVSAAAGDKVLDPTELEEERQQQQQQQAWMQQKKQYLVLTSAGKPVYSRHGDEDALAG